jgi:hypothetical protein
MLCAYTSPAQTAKEALQALCLKTNGFACVNRDFGGPTFPE